MADEIKKNNKHLINAPAGSGKTTYIRNQLKSICINKPERAENDPEYAKYLEERNAEYSRWYIARGMEQMEALKSRAEVRNYEAQSRLAERK